MRLLAPWYLMVAALVGAAVIALHYFARHAPPPAMLPTARFVPLRPERTTARSRLLSDRWLLLLRLALVALVGAALGRPVRAPEREPVRRIIVIDVSRAGRSIADVRDSAVAVVRPGDIAIIVDSAARRISVAPIDSVRALQQSPLRGSLSAALLAALRAAPDLRAAADSLELVLVSPLASEELDAATESIRALWPGRARILRVTAAKREIEGAVAIRAPADDPLVASLTLLGRSARGEEAMVRIVRDAPTANDTAWRGGRDGRVLVHWRAAPEERGAALAAHGDPAPDTVGAVVGSETVVVAPFVREERLDAPGAVIARWVDGIPAAVERRDGVGCTRDVRILVPPVGDLALRPSFLSFLEEMTAPCADRTGVEPVHDSTVAMLAGGGPLLPTGAVPVRDDESSMLAPWLLVAALFLAAVEPLLRARLRS